MKTTTLLIEFLIIGFLGSVILFFGYGLICANDFDSLWKYVDEVRGNVAVVTVLVFYSLGAIIHRLIEIIVGRVFYGKSTEEDKVKMIDILQHGSDNLNNRLSYETSLMRIFASTSVLMLIIGIMYIVLSCKFDAISHGGLGFLIAIIIVIMSIVCYIAQRRSIGLLLKNFDKAK